MGSTLLGSGGSQWSRAQEVAYAKVDNEFGSLPYNCASLDLVIKKIAEKLLSEIKKDPLPSLEQRAYNEALEIKKNALEFMWSSKNCRDVIENIRAESTAIVLTDSAIKQEDSVLDKGNKNENLYIGLGGLVLLVGLYIVLNK